MARKRFVDPNFWTDIDIAKLQPIERLFFIGCFSNADDEGRLPANPAYLRSVIFPYDDIPLSEIQAMRNHIVEICKNLILYEVDGNEFLTFTRWRRYQSPRYPQPSQFPAPPIDETLTQDCNQKDARLTQDYGNDDSTVSEWDQVGVGDQDQVGDQVRDQEMSSSSSDETAPPAPEPYLKILAELKKVAGYPFDPAKDMELITALVGDFPGLNLLTEVKQWAIYKLDKPLKPKSNPRLQFRHWCEISAGKKPNTRAPDKDKYADLVVNRISGG